MARRGFKRRKFKLRRRGYRRRRFNKRFGRSTKRLAKKVRLHDKLFERKYYYNTATSSTLVTGLSFTAPQQIALGTAVNNRIGNRIFLKNITIRAELAMAGTTQYTAGTDLPVERVRIVAVLFKNANQAGALTNAQIFADTTNADTIWLSPFQRERAGKVFKVIMDKHVMLTPSTDTSEFPTAHGQYLKYFTWVFKIHKTVIFGGNTAQASDIIANLFQLQVQAINGGDGEITFRYSYIMSYIDA